MTRDATCEQARLTIALNEPPTRHRLPQHDADREQIGAMIDRGAARLLGRHVRELALEDTLSRARRRACCLGNPEVDELHLAVVADEHVLGAHVAVDDTQRRAIEISEGVRVLEARQHVGQDSNVQIERHVRPADTPKQGV